MSERPRMLALLLVGTLMAIIGFSVAAWALVDDADPGHLAGWVEALATLTALVAATIAAVYASSAFNREVKRDKQLEKDRRSEQAGLVASWATAVQWKYSATLTSSIDEVELFIILLRNASTTPIYELRAEVLYLPPDNHAEPVLMGRLEEAFMAPGGSELMGFRNVYPDAVLTHATFDGMAEPDIPGRLRVRLTFTDNGGQRWRRDEVGLSPVDKDGNVQD